MSAPGHFAVVGNINVDLLFQCQRVPAPSEVLWMRALR